MFACFHYSEEKSPLIIYNSAYLCTGVSMTRGLEDSQLQYVLFLKWPKELSYHDLLLAKQHYQAPCGNE